MPIFGNLIMKGSLNETINSYEKEMIDFMSKMIEIPAIAPQAGGEGESKRADFIQHFLKEMGQEVKRFDYTDKYKATRSNLVTTFGEGAKTIWILSHLDTVSPGDLSLWKYDPFKAYIKDGKLYGRGTSDNGQGVVTSIFALKALKETKTKPKYRLGLALVADEETGSEYGVKKLIKEGIFKKGDMMVVPDWGTEKGNEIEIAEKGILWLKFRILGKQVHASTPQLGINAYRVSIMLLSELDKRLHSKYSSKDALFNPPYSTFEMTKHELNVDSTNIIPGAETFYMDCRILPKYSIEKILEDVKKIAGKIEKETRAKIEIKPISREDPAKPVPADSEIVKLLSRSIEHVRKTKVSLVGIGGGTVAKYFRDRNLDAAVWATLPDNAHQPNEYLVIDDMIKDTQVFANLFV